MWRDLARSAAAEAVIAEEEEEAEAEGSAVAEGAIEVGLELVAR